MQTGCRPILLLLLVLPLTHSGAGDFLETGEMSSGALDMRVSETVEAGWRHSKVHTTFEFYLPYFVPGEDAELMHTAASDDEGSIMIFIGSWGMEDPYPEGFMEDLAVTVNSAFIDPKLSEMNRRAVLVYDMYGDPTIRAEDICGDYTEGET
jgi:hypothetical protein